MWVRLPPPRLGVLHWKYRQQGMVNMTETLDAETIYLALRAAAEEFGFVSDYADEKLGEAAEAIASAEEN
jgi:hypothetical protein